MIEKVTFSQEIASDPLAITRVDTEVFFEIGEGDDLRSFSFNCANDSEKEGLFQFETTLARFANEARIEAMRRSVPTLMRPLLTDE
jgi:hypothetical protein